MISIFSKLYRFYSILVEFSPNMINVINFVVFLLQASLTDKNLNIEVLLEKFLFLLTLYVQVQLLEIYPCGVEN